MTELENEQHSLRKQDVGSRVRGKKGNESDASSNDRLLENSQPQQAPQRAGHDRREAANCPDQKRSIVVVRSA
ncbi:MAG: hypothetical protein V4719_24665, partial [Planctomycetota bacterium]